jgi:hypothetical protein
LLDNIFQIIFARWKNHILTGSVCDTFSNAGSGSRIVGNPVKKNPNRIRNPARQINPDFSISSSVAFTKPEFESFLRAAVPLGIYIGGGGLLLACGIALLKALQRGGSIDRQCFGS